MISPFESKQVRNVSDVSDSTDGKLRISTPRRVISYGTSSMGYDLRLADEFKVFSNARCSIVDPKQLDERALVDVVAEEGPNGRSILVPPNSFALGRSLEKLSIPRKVTGIILGKSSYARVGIVVNCTPAESGWCGYLTIEISNTTPLPARVYAGEGIAQILFFESDEEPEVAYGEREGGGKYQDQKPEITLPRL